MTLGFIRISTIYQDLENQRNVILHYAQGDKLLIDEFFELKLSTRKKELQDELENLLLRLNKGDTLIMTELSRLGRSVSEVTKYVNQIIEKGVRLICLKEGIDLKNQHSMQSKVMITMFSLFGELERDLISQRTKEALATKKAQGVKLGRPKGPGKSKLDPRKEEIQLFLDKKVSKLSISKILGVSYPTLYNFVAKHKMN
jgi:DNA invertase Pin-like site-specific DNA recombinase